MKRPEIHVVEAEKRLSQSLIWRLQRRFFEQRGVAAFSQGQLPHYITSNPFIAQAYARVVLGYLRDKAPRLCPDQPLYIIELGAGTGRFGFHFLKKFSRLLAQSPLRELRWCYVLTDFTASLVNPWLDHPALRPFVASGNLDFALFDATQPSELLLQRRGTTLTPEAVKNPLVVLANYVFDGLPQDAFRLQDGRLYESLVTLTSFQPEPDLQAAGLLDRLDVLYEQRPVRGDYYADKTLNRLLQTYSQGPQEGMLLFPSATLSCLSYLRRLSGDRLLLLTGDKGDPTDEAPLPQSAPAIVHHGSISMMVNYHAIGEYVRQEGGELLTTRQQHANLNVSAFILDAQEKDHPETRHAYLENVQSFGPDDYFLVRKSIEGNPSSLKLEQILAWLRFSGWDFWILGGCYAALLRCLPDAAEPWRKEVRRAIAAVWDTYYHIGEKWDLPLHLGTLLCAMDCHSEALKYFQFSLELFGPGAETLSRIAECRGHESRPEAARS